MSESSDLVGAPSSLAAGPPGERSPGALLRALREKQGMHIGVLATTLKVSPRKLEMLEADRFEELPDATFVKALALAVCRALRADATEVMAAYAARDLATDPFKDTGKGLNAPMGSGGRGAALAEAWSLTSVSLWTRWFVGLLAAVLVAVLAWMVWSGGAEREDALIDPRAVPSAPVASRALPSVSPPGGSLAEAPRAVPGDSSVVASGDGAASTAPAGTLPAAVHTAPPNAGAGLAVLPSSSAFNDPARNAGGVASGSTESLLKVSVSADSWLEVVDASRRVVWSQVVPEGESVQLTALPPLQVVVGNARATRLEFAGQPVDLTAHVRGNVARLQVP